MLVYPVHEEPEDVAMEGPGQKFSSGLPPRPRAGEETLAQPGTQKFVVKTFKIRLFHVTPFYQSYPTFACVLRAAEDDPIC